MPSEPQKDDDVVDTCEVEWEYPKSDICNPHSCDLLKYHEGPHECSCGWKRRAMYRDEPERFDGSLRESPLAQAKCCGACKEVKPLSQFHKDRSRTDGYSFHCRPCRAEYYRRAIYPKLKVSDRYQAGRREQQKLYRQRHPERARAHVIAQRIPVQSLCQQCGASDGPLHRHHPDYSQPKNVVTLCVPCHQRTHHAKPD